MQQQFIELLSTVFTVILFFLDIAFIWLPIVLAISLYVIWMRAIRAEWIAKIDWVMLEMKLPQEIRKTPQAMEIVLNGLYQGSKGSWLDKVSKGRLKNWFSLELVSIEGNVKFFIRTPTMFRDVIEAQIYSQYPTIEIYEVPDYTRDVDYKGKDSEWSVWGAEFKLQKEDAYPIRTYIDYGMDREGTKEEEKTDPMTSTIEYLGSLGRGEQAWIQILIQTAGSRFSKPGKWFKKEGWKEQGEALIKKISDKAKKDGAIFSMLSKSDDRKVEAIERNISKLGFDCGIRTIYLARDDTFRPSIIQGMVGAFRQYNSNQLNGFKPTNSTSIDFPWQDFRKIRLTKMKKNMIDAYKRRSYFYLPYKKTPFTLNTEELATIFHFPGSVAGTPTFGRIQSKKSEPPMHLPQ